MASYRLPDGTVPVLVSAMTADLLADEAAALLAYATTHPAVPPEAIADMLFRTRVARPHRALAMVSSRDQLLAAFDAIVDGREHPGVVRSRIPATARRIATVFPGQGGQRPGMGRPCYQSVSAFRVEADRCAEAFCAELGRSPLEYLLDEDHPDDDSAGIVQPALFTQMAALAAMWRSFGVDPDVVIGHSQGEVAAAYASGVITLADAVRVIGIRASAADGFAAGDYAMAVIAAGRDACETILARCSGWAELSVINSPDMTGVSGQRATVHDIVDAFTERGVFARMIRVAYPAHTSLINQVGTTVRTACRDRLENPTFRDTDTACLGTTLGAGITPDLPVSEYWFWNLRNVVRFDKAVTAARTLGVDTFVELGDHPALQSAIEENLAGSANDTALVLGTSRRDAIDLGVFTRNLAVVAVNDLDYPWEHLRTGVDHPPPPPLSDFPNTQMNEVRLWLPYRAETAATSAAAEPEPTGQTAPARLFTERWVRLSQREMTPPRVIGIVDHTGGHADLVAALGGAAADIGATAQLVDSRRNGDGSAGGTPEFDTCVILAPPSTTPDACAAATAVSTFFGHRVWWPGIAAPIVDCWLVTVGSEVVCTGDASPDLVSAGLSAGFRSIGAEHPGVRFRHLDLPAGSAPTAMAAALVSALHTEHEPELALRDDGLYAKRMDENAPPAADSAGAPPGHVLITGGTGNLGLEFCEYFARRGVPRITLVSRSGATAPGTQRLQRIRSATSTGINVVRCDIADPAAVSRLVERHRENPAELIIHAALVYSDAELADITVEQAERVLRSKVVGIARVLDRFPRTDNCRVVLCSSIAATIGGRGQIVYAAANRMLDALAHRLRADGLDCVSVQWGQWTAHFDLDPVGWAKLAATGLLPMRPADAMATGLAPLHHNVVVAGFDLTRARPVLTAYGYGPLLAQLPDVAAPHAGVEEPALEQRLIRLLAGTIGAAGTDAIDPNAPMVAIGLDSLQALEFRRRVKTELNHELDVAQLLGGASLADVVVQLAQ